MMPPTRKSRCASVNLSSHSPVTCFNDGCARSRDPTPNHAFHLCKLFYGLARSCVVLLKIIVNESHSGRRDAFILLPILRLPT